MCNCTKGTTTTCNSRVLELKKIRVDLIGRLSVEVDATLIAKYQQAKAEVDDIINTASVRCPSQMQVNMLIKAIG